MTSQQLQDEIQILRKEMIIDKSELSSTKRKLISAKDDRVSVIGCIGGIVITYVGVVISDMEKRQAAVQNAPFSNWILFMKGNILHLSHRCNIRNI